MQLSDDLQALNREQQKLRKLFEEESRNNYEQNLKIMNEILEIKIMQKDKIRHCEAVNVDFSKKIAENTAELSKCAKGDLLDITWSFLRKDWKKAAIILSIINIRSIFDVIREIITLIIN